jgi:hypothetical protein
MAAGAHHTDRPEGLVEDRLQRHPGVDAAEHHRVWLLAAGGRRRGGDVMAVLGMPADESAVPGQELGERVRRPHPGRRATVRRHITHR